VNPTVQLVTVLAGQGSRFPVPRVTLTVRQNPKFMKHMSLKVLVGSGDKIILFTLPFLVIGLALNALRPSIFRIGDLSGTVRVIALIMLIPGIVVWFWSAVLILVRVPKQQLITGGPFALVKHPVYTSVALLVLPAIGLLLNSWLGVGIGIVLYVGSRIFAPGEERQLSVMFGPAWSDYINSVKMRWL
jgi:protein-S-isoprenylcysteine O-methyltransferase Ste14